MDVEEVEHAVDEAAELVGRAAERLVPRHIICMASGKIGRDDDGKSVARTFDEHLQRRCTEGWEPLPETYRVTDTPISGTIYVRFSVLMRKKY